MEDEILRILATAAAGVLVRAMGTRLWTSTRDRWADLLGRSDSGRRAELAERLDASAGQVAQADAAPRVVDAVTEQWRESVRAELEEHPHLVDATRSLLEEEVPDARPAPGVTQTARLIGGFSIQSGGDTTIGRP